MRSSSFVGIVTAVGAALAMLLLLLPGHAAGAERSPAGVRGNDRIVFGHDVTVDVPAAGNVQVWGGSVVITSVVAGDVLVLFGNATLGEGAHVGGDLICVGGRISGAQGRVHGRVYAPGTLEGAIAMLGSAEGTAPRQTLAVVSLAVKLSLLVVWLLAALAWTAVSGREVRLSSAEVRASALHCFTLGLVAVTSFVLTAIVCSFLVPYLVGIPLLGALGVFAVLTKIYGMIAVFHATGSLIARSRTREEFARRTILRGDLAMIVVGVLVLGGLRMIPGAGTIIWGLASIFGVGVALATKFGRREPWFLAWRAVEV